MGFFFLVRCFGFGIFRHFVQCSKSVKLPPNKTAWLRRDHEKVNQSPQNTSRDWKWKPPHYFSEKSKRNSWNRPMTEMPSNIAWSENWLTQILCRYWKLNFEKDDLIVTFLQSSASHKQNVFDLERPLSPSKFWFSFLLCAVFFKNVFGLIRPT